MALISGGTREALRNPVLRILVVATLVGAIGRGVFLTITVLYFTFVVGLNAREISVVVGASSAVAIVTSLIGGQLADRFSARRLLVAFLIADSVGLIAYVVIGSFWVALVLACITLGFEAAGRSIQSAVIARAFLGPERVTARAVLRTVTNISIAVGSALAGLALLIGTPGAYRVILVVAGVLSLAASLLVLRLPASVDAPKPAADETMAEAEADALEAARPSRWAHSPWRDPRYLALAALSGIFAMQFGLLEVGVPLWVAHDTQAPKVVVSALLILNTVIVIAFQVRMSRGTHQLRVAARFVAIGGVLMAVACLAYSMAAGVSPVIAVGLLIVAGCAHAFAEVTSQSALWGLTFELADPVKAGAYQGIVGMFFSIGSALAPFVITATALNLGMPGWAILAAMFALSAAGMTAIALSAAKRGAPASSPSSTPLPAP